MPKPWKIEPADALRLWNAGKSVREIARTVPGASPMAALRAVKKAVSLGLGIAVEHEPFTNRQTLAWNEKRISKLREQLAAALAQNAKLKKAVR